MKFERSCIFNRWCWSLVRMLKDPTCSKYVASSTNAIFQYHILPTVKWTWRVCSPPACNLSMFRADQTSELGCLFNPFAPEWGQGMDGNETGVSATLYTTLVHCLCRPPLATTFNSSNLGRFQLMKPPKCHLSHPPTKSPNMFSPTKMGNSSTQHSSVPTPVAWDTSSTLCKAVGFVAKVPQPHLVDGAVELPWWLVVYEPYKWCGIMLIEYDW